MSTTDDPPILVLGATGKTGSRVAARLSEAGQPVRGVSRSSDPPFDWDDRSTWATVLDGVRAAYVAFAPDLSVPGAAEAVAAFAAQARDAGVERLVLLSGRGEEGALAAERAVAAEFADATVIRSAWFAQSFDESFLADPVREGRIVLPAGEVAEPFVDAGDVAEIAAAALTSHDHRGELHEVTGPRLLTFADVAADLTAATGRPIEYVPVSGEEYAAMLAEQQVPADVAEMLNGLFAEVLDGRNASLTDGVQRALGRPPRDFADWAKANADTWSTGGEVA